MVACNRCKHINPVFWRGELFYGTCLKSPVEKYDCYEGKNKVYKHKMCHFVNTDGKCSMFEDSGDEAVPFIDKILRNAYRKVKKFIKERDF